MHATLVTRPLPRPVPAYRCFGRIRSIPAFLSDTFRFFHPSILRFRWPTAVNIALCIQPGAAQAAFTYPGCVDAAESQFQYVPVVGQRDPVSVGSPVKKPLAVDPGLLEPLHLDFDLKADGKVDLYFVEKTGAVKYFDAAANTVALLGNVPGISTGGEMGVSGIALDPDFRSNRWLYLFFAQGSPAEFRVARFTLNAGGKLDNASQKVLLKFRRTGENHTGGAMTFDAYGDLWITVGKNAKDYPNSYHESSENLSTEATSANLADFRGGVLRIHPDNSAKGYSIPAGNFAEYWTGQFRAKGEAALADQYADPAKVLPELYVKGTRNAYSIAVHPTKRWLAWGEFGVNTNNTMTEEHNLVTHPAFGGYPYFAGGFGTGVGSGYYPLWSGTGSVVYQNAHPGLNQDPLGPVNNSIWNKGPKQLPAITPALHTYMHGSGAGAITGPIYHYDPDSKSPIKWPPHFDGSWLITDWVQGTGNNGFKGAKILKLDASGSKVIDSLKWFQNLNWFEPISFDQGPDGAIYVIMYHGWHTATAGTHIGRIEYTGTCQPGPTGIASHSGYAGIRPGLKADLRTVSVLGTSRSRLSVRDSRGREVFSVGQDGPKVYAHGELLAGRKGVHLVELKWSQGSASLKLIGL